MVSVRVAGAVQRLAAEDAVEQWVEGSVVVIAAGLVRVASEAVFFV